MKKSLENNNLSILRNSKKIGVKLFFTFYFLLSAFIAQAQLADFTLTVTKTNETCPGNGTLTFNATNTRPGATINYKVYKLPNTTTAIANLSTNFLGGLSNGNYKIVATQRLGTQSNTQTTEIEILNNTTPLNYDLVSTNAICGNDATITVDMQTGTAISYEILSGPVTRPAQATNRFTMLPAGVYKIRVYDSCGEAFVQTRTIMQDEIIISVGDTAFPDAELTSCNSINVMHTISSSNLTITFPIQYTFTIRPPGGAPTDYTGTVASGSNQIVEITQLLPILNQSYPYDLKIVDGCGNEYFASGNIDTNIMEAVGTSSASNCGIYYLMMSPVNFIPPYTVTFISTPPGFNPSDFNSAHPGPFMDDDTSYGVANVSIPLGDYTFMITDSCNRSDTTTVTVEEVTVSPNVSIVPGNGGCAPTADVKIMLPGRDIATATVISGPPEYSTTYPQDVSAYIRPFEGLVLLGLPSGTYNFILIDVCGISHPAVAVISNSESMSFTARKDCELGKGTLRISGGTTLIERIEMTVAPAGFPNPLPYDVSFNVSGGVFTMAGLIPGSYSFHAFSVCGNEFTLNPNITGYTIIESNYSIAPHCGTFDLELHHTSNALSNYAFWLQKFNPLTNTWGHPETNAPYTEGQIPDVGNSVLLNNDQINYNLAYSGEFRIVKYFETFENGSVGDYKNCVEVLGEFPFIGHPEIVRLKSLTCNGSISDVQVFAEGGVPPYIYEITKKNGADFHIDNGSESIFRNLEPAIYTFRVTDDCGEFRSNEYDVALLPSLAVAYPPTDFLLCDDISKDEKETFTLSTKDAEILGADQSSTEYEVKYYLTADNARTETDPLADAYISETKQIFARVDYINGIDCFAITPLNLKVLEYPTLQMKTKFGICDDGTIMITADSGFDSYLWSNNDTNNFTTFDSPGNYSVTVTKEYGDVVCEGIHEFEIVPSGPPNILEISVSDWTDHENVITVVMDAGSIGDYEYSLDNINFQDENTFYGLETGQYVVYVRDKYGCGPNDFENTHLLTYPKYFTPNQDGYNDYWRIKFSSLEPNMLIYIFDRYGKLITGFRPDSPGWDGTLNGRNLPSTDYWFLVKRENGKEHRGHFAMKR